MRPLRDKLLEKSVDYFLVVQTKGSIINQQAFRKMFWNVVFLAPASLPFAFIGMRIVHAFSMLFRA